MLYPFFEQAGRSVTRQRTFRQLLALHLLVLLGALFIYGFNRQQNLVSLLGQALLLSGIVEGALLIGWRLTQLPKSNFLEPLLLTPVPTPLVMLGEELVGLSQLALIHLAGVPILVALVQAGWLHGDQAVVIGTHGLIWGAVTGLGLTAWAYEPQVVRLWGTRFSAAMLLTYLVIGGLLGEQTFGVLSALPGNVGYWIRDAFFWMHFNNPFSVIHLIGQGRTEGMLPRLLLVDGLGLVAGAFFFLRAAFRLKGHYIDRHFRPVANLTGVDRGTIGDRPMNWWAIRRVSEYAGHINLYLAFGASVAYSLYLVLGDRWPRWLGTHVFVIMEMLGGVPAICTVLFLLAAVPFAYQYGLWDSSVPARCRRLELLLLTELNADDYVQASWLSSWHRGKGYLFAAAILLIAGWYTGRYPLLNTVVCFTVGLCMIYFYFAVGFRVFARNTGATAIGFALTVIIPLLSWGLSSIGMSNWTRLLPPSAAYYSLTAQSLPFWLPVLACILLCLTASTLLLRRSMSQFDRELRTWYDRNCGKRT